MENDIVRIAMTQIPHTSLDEEELRSARETPPAEKLIAGARLFDFACAITAAGIRRQHPTASDEQVLEILRERLEWASRWE
jgi:hypothetical protein